MKCLNGKCKGNISILTRIFRGIKLKNAFELHNKFTFQTPEKIKREKTSFM